MRNPKTYTSLAGALALLLLVVAAPAAFSQDDQPQPDRPMGEQHHHMHGQHHGQTGEMPEGHAERMEKHRAMMAEHKAAMEAHMARMDELVAEMNQATGDAKTDAVAAVLNEMWSHHQTMREHMGDMGMMGMGMMGGHPCPMHGTGECPMMKETMDEQ
jgi:hypothetical protein